VGTVPGGTVCAQSFPTLPPAVTAATNDVDPNLIRVGPGNFSATNPYGLAAGDSIQGSGAGTNPANATALSVTAGSAQTLLSVNGGTVSDLRVVLSTNTTTGIHSINGTLDNLVVFGPGSTGSTGIRAQGTQLRDATVNVTGGSGNTALRSDGGNLLLRDSTWNGGAIGYQLVSGTDNVSRVTVTLADTAISVEGGTLNIDDAVIDLGATGQTGLQARPTGSADTATVNANHLTVVGGNGTSSGVVANANGSGTRTAVVDLKNSIVRGPATSLRRDAGAGHTANFTVTRSSYQATVGAPTDGGGNLVNVDPGFVNPAAGDYHLRATSPVVDKAASSTASLDRDGKERFDGDKNGIPEPDMGAYELRDVTAPKTTFSAGPNGPTNDSTPLFVFKGSDDTARFECSLDGGAFQLCSSPATTTPLADGPHSFAVRASDEVFNVENPPATRRFTVDTTTPNATITKKPAKRFFKKRVRFKFASDEAGATFQCMLDNRSWHKCRSPFRFNVKVGKHRMLVRAVDAAGNVDPTPARYKYRRLQHRR
jgi:hypothetical protein